MQLSTALKAYVVTTPERCSATYILATAALLSSMMQLAATTIYKEYGETLQKPAVIGRWFEVRLHTHTQRKVGD